MHARHAMLTFWEGLVYLCPLQGAVCYLNGMLLSPTTAPSHVVMDGEGDVQAILLRHRSRLIFGRHHVFRFEHGSSLLTPSSPASHMIGSDVPDDVVIDWDFAQREVCSLSYRCETCVTWCRCSCCSTHPQYQQYPQYPPTPRCLGWRRSTFVP
jgi:hypothetical protein